MKFEYENDWLIFNPRDIRTSQDMDALNRILEQMLHVYCCEAWEPAAGLLELASGAKYIGITVDLDHTGSPDYFCFPANTRKRVMMHVAARQDQFQNKTVVAGLFSEHV